MEQNEGRITHVIKTPLTVPTAEETREATKDFRMNSSNVMRKEAGSQNVHSNVSSRKDIRLHPKAGSNITSELMKVAGMGQETRRARTKYYWDPTVTPTLIGIPYNIQENKSDFIRLHKWMNFYYSTHYLFGGLVDIYASFPLVGFEHSCKDPAIKRFFDDVFLDDLDYVDFLTELNREYWKCGEAWAIAEWDDDIGCYVDDELINPVTMDVEVMPVNKIRRFYFDPPKYLQRIIETQDPLGEYDVIKRHMPELMKAVMTGTRVLIDDPSLVQLRFGGSRWTERGEPIMMRGLRQFMIEEKLHRAQNAICDRLIAPLILAKLGKEGTDAEGGPWLPAQEDIDEVQNALENAMDSDYRMLVYHYGLEIDNVLGYEAMPKLKEDYDDLEEKMCLIFGISPDILKGGGTQPYASTALSADFLSQRMKANQKMLINFVLKNRYEEVARAQGFWDYEIKGERKQDIEEFVVRYDEEGNKKIFKRKKPLVPDIHLATMNFRDEATQRQFVEQLSDSGIPISNRTRVLGVDIDFDDEVDSIINEAVTYEKNRDQLRNKFIEWYEEEKKPVDLPYIEKLVDKYFPTVTGSSSPKSNIDDSDIDSIPNTTMDEDLNIPRPKMRPDVSDEMKGEEKPEDITKGPETEESTPAPTEAPSESGGGEGEASFRREPKRIFVHGSDQDEEYEAQEEELKPGQKVVLDKSASKNSLLRVLGKSAINTEIPIDKEEIEVEASEEEVAELPVIETSGENGEKDAKEAAKELKKILKKSIDKELPELDKGEE